MNPRIRSLLILLGTASMASAASTLVNLDWNVTGSGGPSGSYSGTGVLGGGVWNNPVHARTGTAGHTDTRTNLLDSTGSATMIGVAVATFNNSYDAGFQASVDDSVDPLFSDTLYLYGTQSSATITFSGLGASTPWNLVLFGADGRGEGSTFTIGGTAKTTSDTGGIGATLVEGDEYVRFNNITSDGSGKITVAWTKPGAFGAINGFQLQQVPEPAAALLSGLGLLGLLRRRR